MKLKIIIIILSVFQLSVSAQQDDLWKLIFEDEFSAQAFDSRYWSYCTRANPDWAKYLTSSLSTVNTADGMLKVRLIKNPNTTVDNVPYLSGGIQTRGKFNFKYGKVEVRAKFTNGQGSWPAIWMMPEDRSQPWPACGEIDIMEHINSENQIHQTIHSDFANAEGQGIRNPSPTKTTAFDKEAFNVYGVEWHPDRLDFTLNGQITFTYPRINTTKTGQWPFDKSFYIILNMAGGGSWTGAINETALPFEMQVDWVRVYERNAEGPYIVPGWTSSKTQNDAYWANTFVKKITTEGATNTINYEAHKRYSSYFYLHPDTLVVPENTDLKFNLTAYSLGNYNESTVLQDLRYTCNYVFADFDGDKRFEVSLPRIGNVPPANGVGGNMDVMNIVRQIRMPEKTAGNKGRIRIVYDNAWADRFSPEVNVREGLVYDFPLKITQNNTGLAEYSIKPVIYRSGNRIFSENISGAYMVDVYNVNGQKLHSQKLNQPGFSLEIPEGLVLLRLTYNDGQSFSYRF